MQYNFDEIVPRKGTNSVKYDALGKWFNAPDATPLWVADMDFRTPPFIIDAIKQRLEHEVLGYSIRPDEYFESIVKWVRRRHQWEIENEDI